VEQGFLFILFILILKGFVIVAKVAIIIQKRI